MDLRESVDEQAALRRVATLVACGAAPEDVFAAAAAEAGRLVSGDRAVLSRYDAGDVATVVGAWSGSGGPLPAPVGSRFGLGQQDLLTLVFHARKPVRIDDYAQAGLTASSFARQAGVRKGIGVPIDVDGRLWGVLIVATMQKDALPPQAEARLIGFTELVAASVANAHAGLEVRRFADEQSALRRVATLVARAAPPDRIFASVAEEVGRLLQVGYTVLSRYDPDGDATVVGGWARTDPGRPLALGVRMKPEGRNIHALVFESRAPARIDDYDSATGDLGELAQNWGYRSAVGVPITVEDDLWGVMIVGSLSGPLAANTEVRLVGFTELVAAALSNAQAQAALTASRARIVAAEDTARRVLERNLHDGAQQHLVTLALQLREVQATVPPEAPDMGSRLDEVATGMASVLDELREIARGIRPAGLSAGGLRQALTTLADRSAVPVRLDVQAEAEIPERIGVAAYYVVAESLANAAKHAEASFIVVRVRVFDGELLISVRDDGRGGADLAHGSGLVGLQDRVEALGGRLSLRSPSGVGTAVDISLPLSDERPE